MKKFLCALINEGSTFTVAARLCNYGGNMADSVS